MFYRRLGSKRSSTTPTSGRWPFISWRLCHKWRCTFLYGNVALRVRNNIVKRDFREPFYKLFPSSVPFREKYWRLAVSFRFPLGRRGKWVEASMTTRQGQTRDAEQGLWRKHWESLNPYLPPPLPQYRVACPVWGLGLPPTAYVITAARSIGSQHTMHQMGAFDWPCHRWRG